MKKILFSAITIAILVGSYYGAKSWLKSLLPSKAHFEQIKQSTVADLPYLTEGIPAFRGKILAVVTSTDSMGKDTSTGYEHTELARAYWVFIANGFEVDIASPKGGTPPVVYDGEDMGAYDYAFLNDAAIQDKLNHSIPLSEVNANEYEAVYFVGGKGTMFDFPNNPHVKKIARTLYQNDKVVSAVCHGPAALVNVELDNGEMLLANKKVSSFTNEEELMLIPEAEEIFPFLLQSKLAEQGANFQQGAAYLEQVVQDGKLITGQNPWSVWLLAELVVEELGYKPKLRVRTSEEHSIDLLMTYNNHGYEAASDEMSVKPQSYQIITLLMHGIFALMQGEVSKGVDILSLANQLKEHVG